MRDDIFALTPIQMLNRDEEEEHTLSLSLSLPSLYLPQAATPSPPRSTHPHRSSSSLFSHRTTRFPSKTNPKSSNKPRNPLTIVNAEAAESGGGPATNSSPAPPSVIVIQLMIVIAFPSTGVSSPEEEEAPSLQRGDEKSNISDRQAPATTATKAGFSFFGRGSDSANSRGGLKAVLLLPSLNRHTMGIFRRRMRTHALPLCSPTDGSHSFIHHHHLTPSKMKILIGWLLRSA